MKNQPTMADEVITLLKVRHGVNELLNSWIDRARRKGEWENALYLCERV